MRSATGASPGSATAGQAMPAAGRARLLSWLAMAGIGSSILIMIAASAVRDSWMYPPIKLPGVGPPWDLTGLHMSTGVAMAALWTALIIGALGVIAGLGAVQRGARPSVRMILIAAAVTVVLLTVFPPAGSTDAFDYAAYGRLLVLGHSPYVATPHLLRATHDAIARSVPTTWQKFHSVYGPLGALEQFFAAKLGGTSAARITFWLKLWDSIAFGVVAYVADRMLRSNPAQRLRAHLLWTINPLLLWDLIAAGHIDVLAAAFGLLGVLVLGQHSETARPSLLRVLAAGVLIGAAADIKANFVLFGLGLAWVLRRSLTGLVTAAAGALVVLLPSYIWFGLPAVHALSARRNGASADSFYTQILGSDIRPHLAEIAAVLIIAVAVLTSKRMPMGDTTRPVIRAALVLSVAWLFFWPYQFPWYDTMIIVLLMFYPATRIDWLVIARVAVGSLPNTPGNPTNPPGHVLDLLHHWSIVAIAPLVLLAAALGLIVLCVTRQWTPRLPGGPPGPAPEEPELVPSAANLFEAPSAANSSDATSAASSEATSAANLSAAALRLRWPRPRLSPCSRPGLGREAGQDRSPAARSR